MNVLRRLTDLGNTIIVIEHNLDVIKMADYIIDLGPEGGDAGGEVIATGPPEKIIKNTKSYTAQYLKEKLNTKKKKGSLKKKKD
jgi:excinuclease ABC subunit A